jgi:hydroxyethylthiazole kinase-like uncharacterized protein yjeF
MKIATVAEIREMDRQTTEEYHVPSLILMERAALQVTRAMEERFGLLGNKRIAVVCGKGNNGGDGLAIARELFSGCHAQVTVWQSTEPFELRGDAATNYKIAEAYGVAFRPTSELDLSQVEIVVDALFGTGIKGAVTGAAAKIIDLINNSGKTVVSVDVPSGLNSDTGKAEGAVVHATFTVTFALAKIGLIEYPGAQYAGELVVAGIGMPSAVMEAHSIKTYVTEAADIKQWLPARVNGRDANKGTFGHVIAIAGSEGFVGAPILVAEAAARSGAGLVTLVVPQVIARAISSRISPVVMTSGVGSRDERTFDGSAIDATLRRAEKATAVSIGPGMGQGDNVIQFVGDFVARCPRPIVIDADALNALASNSDRGASIIQRRSAATILTPHPGEMGRLLSIETKAVENDRRSAVIRAAQLYKCIVLLKGARTWIAEPDGTLYLNSTGNPGMGTGGTGDVLTGVITSLLSQKLKPLAAAAAGAYIHGLSGDLAAALRGGATGLIATDIIRRLPYAFACCQGAKIAR